MIAINKKDLMADFMVENDWEKKKNNWHAFDPVLRAKIISSIKRHWCKLDNLVVKSNNVCKW